MPKLKNRFSLNQLKSIDRTKALAWVLLIAGFVGFAISLHPLPKPLVRRAPPRTAQSNISADKPSASEIATYTVAADLPKYIRIPVNQDQIRIRQLGLARHNQIAAPDNLYDAGWYNASAKPGQAGAVFIYGHRASWSANGAFHNLGKLKVGDIVKVTRGDDQIYHYEVKSLKTYPATNVDMSAVLRSINAGRQGLNLMTCTGDVDKKTGDYDQRLVVFTSRVY